MSRTSSHTPSSSQERPNPLTRRGFILQSSYRLAQGRPTAHLFGKFESGETFLIRDDRQRPHFFILQADADRAKELGASQLQPSSRVAYRSREALLQVSVQTPADLGPLSDRLHRAGLQTFEADLRFASRLLLEQGIRSGFVLEAEGGRGSGVDLVFDNPDLRPDRWNFTPSVLSVDIETDPRARGLLSIGLAGCGAREVLLLCPPSLHCPQGARPFQSEGDLLRAFCRRVKELDPDILTGWNVIDFDFRVLAEVAQRCRVSLALGRGPGELRLRPMRTGRNALAASVPGRLILDGVRLLRGSSVILESYSLDAVAKEFLGTGKVSLESPVAGGNRAQAILRQFREDRERFVEYNLRDAELVLEIFDHLGLIELAVERSFLTGLPLDRVASSVAAFEFLYISDLFRRGIAAPSLESPEIPRHGSAGGGHVFEPVPGLYRNVLVFDFQSLYPSIIRTFQIDPLGWVPTPEPGEDLIEAPNGAAFRRGQGILPSLLDELVPRRQEAKDRGDAVASQAIKILMNSFYGVLGTTACRFHHPVLANAITSFGRELLLGTKKRIENAGYRVLYGDTDSLFVLTEAEDPVAARQAGRDLVEFLNRQLAAFVREEWNVRSHLALEFETLYLRLFLPPMRNSKTGARKRYAGMIEEDGRRKVVFTGLEAVRRDWTELAREVQREVYQRLFFDRPVEKYLRTVVEELRRGEHDDRLIYLKALRKSLGAYARSSPPHVVAARKMRRKPGRLIRYVITKQGPEPVENRSSPLDHEHYVAKQIRPVVEPVLDFLGLRFEKVVGDDRQLDLF